MKRSIRIRVILAATIAVTGIVGTSHHPQKSSNGDAAARPAVHSVPPALNRTFQPDWPHRALFPRLIGGLVHGS
ncbi:MAG TPA: hypothetical protein VE398_18745 [Acidobacteriota bacterium]|nr:hypothetical protein [Acidobacteriota bacterium]